MASADWARHRADLRDGETYGLLRSFLAEWSRWTGEELDRKAVAILDCLELERADE